MLADEGVTVTEATGTGAAEMVITDVPVLPSLVAVTVAAPTDTAVTSPFASTDAAALSDDQVTARPVSTLLLASFSVAVSCCVAPTTALTVAGLTETVATGSGADVRVPPSQSSIVARFP